MDKHDDSIGRWISILYRHGQNFLGKRLSQYNIGSGQLIILLTIERKGAVNQECLSDHLKIDKGTIAKSVKRLEEEGYVVRNVDSYDKRAYRIFLTQKALDIMPALRGEIKSWETNITSDFSEDERKLFKQLLQKMSLKACNIKSNS